MSEKIKVRIEHHVIVEYLTDLDEYNEDNPTDEEIAEIEKENFLYYLDIVDFKPEEILKSDITVKVERISDDGNTTAS